MKAPKYTSSSNFTGTKLTDVFSISKYIFKNNETVVLVARISSSTEMKDLRSDLKRY